MLAATRRLVNTLSLQHLAVRGSRISSVAGLVFAEIFKHTFETT